jgi:hypothetical protein
MGHGLSGFGDLAYVSRMDAAARVDKQVQQPGQTVALRLLAGESLSHSQAL